MMEVIIVMEKMLTRKEAAGLLGISIATLDAARTSGQISFVQYVENGCVYFTEESLQEYIARATHRAKPREINTGNRYTRVQVRR
jgi:predicted site-specific integrase-resolvase